MAKASHRGSHKYLRLNVRGRHSVNKHIFRCAKPGCSHYLTEQFIVGAVAECWRCERDFVIDRKTALKKPHCRECTRGVVEKVPGTNIVIPESPI
jgi:hypothetical protein